MIGTAMPGGQRGKREPQAPFESFLAVLSRLRILIACTCQPLNDIAKPSTIQDNFSICDPPDFSFLPTTTTTDNSAVRRFSSVLVESYRGRHTFFNTITAISAIRVYNAMPVDNSSSTLVAGARLSGVW